MRPTTGFSWAETGKKTTNRAASPSRRMRRTMLFPPRRATASPLLQHPAQEIKQLPGRFVVGLAQVGVDRPVGLPLGGDHLSRHSGFLELIGQPVRLRLGFGAGG